MVTVPNTLALSIHCHLQLQLSLALVVDLTGHMLNSRAQSSFSSYSIFNFQAHTPMVVECCHCILMVCMTFNTGALFLQVFFYIVCRFLFCVGFLFFCRQKSPSWCIVRALFSMCPYMLVANCLVSRFLWMCYHVRLLHGKVIHYSGAGSTGFLIPFTKKFYRSCPQSGVQNWMIQWSSHLHIDLFFSTTWFPKVTNIKLFFQFVRFVSHSVFVWFSFLFLLLLGRRVTWINILYNFNRRPRL